MVYSSVDEEADSGWTFVISYRIAEMENIFRWVMGGGHERVPPRLLDGQDIIPMDSRISKQSRHYCIS
jgi:hypothetical protein